MCRRNGSEPSPNLKGHGFELSIRCNLQSSAKGFLISSLVVWQRFVDVKHYYVSSIYCKQLRFESRSFLKGHVLFLEIFTDSNFKFVLCINRFLKHLYKMIKMQCKIDSENMVNYR